MHEYRGRRLETDKVERLWNLIEDRGTFRYEINREHPLVVGSCRITRRPRPSRSHAPAAGRRSDLPGRRRLQPHGQRQLAHAIDHRVGRELVELAKAFYKPRGESVEVLAQRLALIEPFSSVKNLESFLREAVGG